MRHQPLTSKVDVYLRNGIANIDFKIDNRRKVSAKSRGELEKGINNLQGLSEFNRKYDYQLDCD
ncbi:hypothetical protein E3J49_02090 [Candidatus Bathyarchaeota archaeon]|nr:MAG: hypothetical protein E3J49_02090 [Candidatus Bathyarchaeota archaeon]